MVRVKFVKKSKFKSIDKSISKSSDKSQIKSLYKHPDRFSYLIAKLSSEYNRAFAIFFIVLMLSLPFDFSFNASLAYAVDSSSPINTGASTLGGITANVPEWATSMNTGVNGTAPANSIVTVYINGNTFTSKLADANGFFSFSRLVLVSGITNTIKFKAETSTPTGPQITESSEYKVQVDDSIPTFTEISQLPAVIGNSTYHITGVVSEVVKIIAEVNSEQTVISENATSFSYDLPLNDGDNEIRIIATDKAGNSKVQSFSAKVDSETLEFLSDNIADLSPTYSKKVVIKGKLNKNATVRIYMNGANNMMYQCSDGLDNDADGLIDYPNDLGCTSPTDMLEANPVDLKSKACADGKDNDKDGEVDFPRDLGCDSPMDTDETNYNGASVCNDQIDNDGDGLTDFNPNGGDPGCSSLSDSDESDDPKMGNVYTVTTDEDGSFSKEVSLGFTTSSSLADPMDSSINTIRVDSKSTEKVALSFNTSGVKNDVRIVAVDGAGHRAETKGAVEYASCGGGYGDFLISQGQVFPGALIPDHIFQGIAQVSFEVNLDYIGQNAVANKLGGKTPENIDLLIGTRRQLSNVDQESWKGLDLFDPNKCQAMPDSSRTKWYVTCQLNRWPPQAYRNLTDAYDYFEKIETVKVPINLEVHYTETSLSFSGNSTEYSKTQIVCYDLEFLLDRRVAPDKIPRDLLNKTVTYINKVLDAIDTILPYVQKAKWITFGICFAMTGVQLFSNLGETSECGDSAGVMAVAGKGLTKDEILNLDRLIRGSPNADSTLNENDPGFKLMLDKYPDPKSEKRQKLQSCADVKAKFRQSDLRRQWVCDRIFCPSVPSEQKYWQDAPKESPCYKNANINTLDNFNYKSNSYITSPGDTTSSGAPTKSYCDRDYEREWNSGCLGLSPSPIEQSKNLQQGNDSAAGLSGVLNKINGLSLCEFGKNSKDSGKVAYSTDGGSVIVDRTGGTPQYQLGRPMSAENLDSTSKADKGEKYYNNANIKFTNSSGGVTGAPSSLYDTDGQNQFVSSNDDCVYVKPNLETQYDAQGSKIYSVITDPKKSGPEDDVVSTVSLVPIDGAESQELDKAYFSDSNAGNKYFRDKAGGVYYTDSSGQMKSAPYYYIDANSFNQSTGARDYKAKLYNDSTPGKKPTDCYSNEIIQGNNVQAYLVDPTDGFINSVRCVCIPAIEGYLISIKNILTAIKSCFESILISNEFDTGICKAILTQYLCDFVFDLLGCLVKSYSAQGAASEEQGGPIKNFLGDLVSGGEKIKDKSMKRYGNTNSFRALFQERQLIHAICLAAFGYDWKPDLDSALSVGGKGFSINSTGIVAPSTRQFIAYNPNADGTATFVYHVGYFLTAGEALNYRVELVCSTTNDCDPAAGFINGICDCAQGTTSYGTATSVNASAGIGVVKILDSGALEGGDSVGSGGGNPYGPGKGDIYQSVNDPIRYDRVRLIWTPRNAAGGKPGEIVVPIRPEGLNAPATCLFSASLMKYSCGYNNPAEGYVYITGVKEVRNKVPSSSEVGTQPFTKNEPIVFQVAYVNQAPTDTDKEVIPRYLVTKICDDQGNCYATQTDGGDSIKVGTKTINVPFSQKTAEQYLGASSNSLVANDLNGVPKGVGGTSGPLTIISGERINYAALSSNVDYYLVFNRKKGDDKLYYTAISATDLMSGTNVISIESALTTRFSSSATANDNTKILGAFSNIAAIPNSQDSATQSLKYVFKGVNNYILTAKNCDVDNCLAVYKLSASTQKTSLQQRCITSKGEPLIWKAKFDFKDGVKTNGVYSISTRTSSSVSATRPTSKEVSFKVSCDDSETSVTANIDSTTSGANSDPTSGTGTSSSSSSVSSSLKIGVSTVGGVLVAKEAIQTNGNTNYYSSNDILLAIFNPDTGKTVSSPGNPIVVDPSAVATVPSSTTSPNKNDVCLTCMAYAEASGSVAGKGTIAPVCQKYVMCTIKNRVLDSSFVPRASNYCAAVSEGNGVQFNPYRCMIDSNYQNPKYCNCNSGIEKTSVAIPTDAECTALQINSFRNAELSDPTNQICDKVDLPDCKFVSGASVGQPVFKFYNCHS